MPEPVPSTAKQGLNKKTIYIALAAGGAIALFLYLKKKKEGEATSTSGESVPYTAQSFIPVTGENVAGAGAGGGSGGGTIGGEGGNLNLLLEAQRENQKFFTEYLKESQQAREAAEKQNREFETELIKSIPTPAPITGGGAPSGGQIGTGGGTGSPPSGGTGGSPPTPPAGTTGCPSSYPHSGPHGCYQIKNCGNGCEGHFYQHGEVECQQGEKKKGNCHW